MRSLLGRFHRPFARGVDEQLLLLNNLGDGSTLSLDFTTGVLDPRLTFTRTTNATFINSQGYVQFANANLMTYSNPRQTGTAWAVTGSVTWGSSTISDPNGGSNAQSITFGTTGSAIFNTTGTTVASGITHTFSVWMRSATGTTNVRIGDANVAPVATVTLTTTWQRFSCQYTTSGTNDGGAIYSQTGTPSAEFYVWGAQVQPGSIVGELIQTSGTINTNTPRFDYDPSTLQPRGLLIEGSASNLAAYSNLQAAWAGGTNTTVTPNTTEVLSPDGTNNAAKVALTNSGYCSRFEAISNLAASTTYTFSYWIRGTAGNQQRVYSVTASADLVTQTTLSYSTSGWTRVQITFTTTAALTTAYIYVVSRPTGTASDVIYIYGAQLETGSGASSYIPTGASTGSRAADSCVMTGTNFSSWFAGATEGVLYAQYEKPRSESGNTAHDHAAVGTRYASGAGFTLYVTGIPQLYPTALLWTTTGAVFPGGFPSAIPAVTKHAAKWFNGNDATNYSNGVQGTTSDATGTVTPTMLCIGAHSTGGTQADRDYLNACVRAVKFWPVALPDSQIIAITT